MSPHAYLSGYYQNQTKQTKNPSKQVLQGCEKLKHLCTAGGNPEWDNRLGQWCGVSSKALNTEWPFALIASVLRIISPDAITAVFGTAPFPVTTVRKQTSARWWMDGRAKCGPSVQWSIIQSPKGRRLWCCSADEPRRHCAAWNGPDSQGETPYDSTWWQTLNRTLHGDRMEGSESPHNACRAPAHQMGEFWRSASQLCGQIEHLWTGCFKMALWWRILRYVIFSPQ